MKKLNEPLSYESAIYNKKKIKIKFIIAMLLITICSSITTYNICAIKHREEIFNSLDITFKEVKAIEYGTANYDPIDLVEEVTGGEIVSYTESIDTSSTGEKELIYVVKEEDVSKVIKINAVVVDTTKPDITIGEENISIEEGNDYNTMDNIVSVVDNLDGDLEYLSDDNNDTAHYSVTTDLDVNKAGTYNVNIKAIDKNGNENEKTFSVNVVAKEKPVIENKENDGNYNNSEKSNAVASVDTSSVVSLAMSYQGYRYTPGGASPETGFDCSGFVYYIYGAMGKQVGRSTSDLIFSGTSVSKSNMQPGDIIIWSSNGYTPTHASLYIGNGNMIHAANSNDGVIVSNVEHWEKYAGSIISIRRV